MMFFTQKGKCYWLKVYEIPEGTKNSKGRAIQNLLNIDSDDNVTAYLRVKSLEDSEFINSHYVLFCTKKGVIKKTLLEQYSRPRQNGVNAITIREDDSVIEVRMTNGNNETPSSQKSISPHWDAPLSSAFAPRKTAPRRFWAFPPKAP